MLANEIEWVLDCEPRPIQQEAILRSYYGYKNRETIKDDPQPVKMADGPHPGFGHLMEMRTGKTPTVLNEFMLLEANHGVKNALIVAPNRFKRTWKLEATKFGVPFPVHVFESQDRFKCRVFMRTHRRTGIVVVNYEALGYEDNLKILDEWVTEDTLIAADESVCLKNRNSLRFKNGFALTRRAKFKRIATGLPAPQAPFDLWAQLRFIGQISGVPFHAFRNKYTIMGGWRGKQPQGIRNEGELNQLLDSMAFRARRGDWSDRIDNDYEMMLLDLLPQQQVAYQTMEQDMITFVSKHEFITVEMVISKVIKLQQISSGFILDEGDVHDLTSFAKTPKFVDLLDRLENMIVGKVIVVAHYNNTCQKLIELLDKFNPAKIVGSRNMGNVSVESQVAKFNEDPTCKVLVGQSLALKYGFTLIGSAVRPCNTLVFYENSYSLDTRAQCEERPQHMAQTTPLHILDYACSAIEEKVIAALQRKKDVAEVIMGYVKEKQHA